MEQLLTVQDVANLIGYTRQAVYKMIERGELKPVSGLKAKRFDPAYIYRFLNIRKQGPVVPLAEYEKVRRERDELKARLEQIRMVVVS